jgi:pimeloyl-ACP methyl ester carboxylesterase
MEMARLVMVHGAFAGEWCWKPVLPGLLAAGHNVETLDLPGSGSDLTPAEEVTLDAYAQRVCEVLAAGQPAVLVGHSMGGMAVTQAAARMPEQIVELVYVSAFLPIDGESLLELTQRPEAAGDEIQANMVLRTASGAQFRQPRRLPKSPLDDPPVTATLPDAAARTAVYGCCSDDEAAWALGFRRPQPLAPMGEPFRLDPGREAEFTALPRRYVTCLRDRCIRPPMQRFMYERAGCDPVIELDTDHAPFLSRTDELVAALDRLATLVAR